MNSCAPVPDKAVNRAAGRVDALGEYFGSSTPAAGSDALILGNSRDQANRTVFADAAFPGSRHRLLVKGAKGMTGSAMDADRIEIVTGVCLFGTHLRVTDERGGTFPLLRPGTGQPTDRLHSITVDDDLSLYEYETVMRQSRVIADLADALPPATPLTITVDVPRVQYYLRLLDAFEDGLVPADMARLWFHLVDERHARILRLFRSRLRSLLAATGREATVRTAPGLAPLADCLQQAVATGDLPKTGDLFSRMIATGTPAWQLLRPLHSPSDREHLARISYAVEYLRAAGIPDADAAPLSIAVDDHTERQIFDHAQHLRHQLGHPEPVLPSLGIYPAETLQALTPDGRPDPLYLADVGRYAVEHTGASVDLFGLVDRLYK
ncbi:hypothetical protein [Streptomyces rimosus]|uniref:hypothetical protein n=1 Tax=Streptomyces rimosus TaxID=1927 RepID=UPI0004CC5B14|nr:hypothetical protein [Streptomyces rimosus]